MNLDKRHTSKTLPGAQREHCIEVAPALALLADLSDSLVDAKTANDGLGKFLERLIEVAQVDRIYVFHNRRKGEEIAFATLLCEASAHGLPPLSAFPRSNVLSYMQEFSRWKAALAQGQPLMGVVDDFPEPEQQILKERNATAILIFPLTARGRWFGFMAFEQSSAVCFDWTSTDINLLKTAANIIGTGMMRKTWTTRAPSGESSETPPSGHITEFIDFAAATGNDPEKTLKDFDLLELLDNIGNILTMEAMAKEPLEIVFQLDPDAPRYLKGDSLRLEQMLILLGDHLVQSSQSGEIVLATQIAESTDERVTVQFSVWTGAIASPAEVVKRLVRSLSRIAPNATLSSLKRTPDQGGSWQWIDLKDGNIWVKNEPANGCELGFKAGFAIGQARKTDPAFQIPDFSNLRALVIDDNPVSRRIFFSMLSDLAFGTVDQAAKGEEALNLIVTAALQHPYDLILLDWQMPGMGGIETAKRIRSLAGLAQQPKIILAAPHTCDVVVAEASQDLDGFLVKPAHQAGLLKVVSQIFTPVEDQDVPGGSESIYEVQGQDAVRAYLDANMVATITCPECEEIFIQNLSKARNIGHGIKTKCRCRCGTAFNVIWERREHLRKSTLLRGAYHHQQLQFRGGIIIKNISKSGAGIVLNYPRDEISIGDHIILKFDLDDQDKTFVTREGVIRKKAGDYLGVKFLSPCSEEDPLSAYIMFDEDELDAYMI